MADEPEDKRTFKEKLLFYITAFFVLLGTFSLFGFLFLVPFVIEPAFTTIFMKFDETPATCVTVEVEHFRGVSNCSWTSCREGCTREVYECTQIRVNYKRNKPPANFTNETISIDEISGVRLPIASSIAMTTTTKQQSHHSTHAHHKNAATSAIAVAAAAAASKLSHKSMAQWHQVRVERGIREYDYADGEMPTDDIGDSNRDENGAVFPEYTDETQLRGLMPNDSEWFYAGAKFFPNVKGCGYPPMLNCTIWSKKYKEIGTNFSCYYSRVDPGIVISDLDMWQNTLNLIYAMAIPIPSFIVSVIYLTFAYYKIYNEDEESAPLDQNAEEIAGEDDVAGTDDVDIIVPNGTATMSVASVPMTPTSDLASFGHQLKVKMADEMSRDSLDGAFISNSGSLHG